MKNVSGINISIALNRDTGKSTGRIILFVGVYPVLDMYIHLFKEILEDKGYECLVIDNNRLAEGLASLAKFVEKPVNAMFTINNLGLSIELVPGKNMWDELGIRCINLLMDHPFHYDNALESAPKDTVILAMDRNHVSYVKRFYKNIACVDFLPHAGIEGKKEHPSLAERDIDVLYMGGLSKHLLERMMPDVSIFEDFDGRRLCSEVEERLIREPDITTEQAIEEWLLSEDCRYNDEDLKLIIYYFRYLDSVAVSYFREKAVKELVEAGIDVTVYGSGWECCEWIDNPHMHFGGKIAPEEVPDLMSRAKIVLNTMTWFKDGTHDRIYNGMLAKALVISDTSAYMNENFKNGEEMLLFDLKYIDTLPSTVNYYLSHLD